MPIVIVRKQKRRAGEKAGLTREGIIDAALKVVETQPLSITPVAKRLRVTPAAVRAHFKDGLATELTRRTLADIFAAIETHGRWQSSLKAIFVAFAHVMRTRPQLALWIGSDLAYDPLLSPDLTETILAIADTAGVPPDRQGHALDLVVGTLIGFVSIGFAPSAKTLAPGKVWPKSLPKRIHDLPDKSYPRLKRSQTTVVANAAMRAPKATPSQTNAVARRFADAAIAGLEKLGN
jgi:AcrR family transcriptional regulator